MKIEKEYDIGQLVEQLQTEVEKSRKYNGVVKLDILTANNILEVLQETHRREQKHQTLERELAFIEKEDGTQTNLMEAKTKCFGCFDGNDIECCMCDDMKQCEEETNRKPDCFGNYEEEDGWEDSCDECMYAKECKKSFINKKKQREGITINE
jgi:hypothetical protein|nr:MAG TPA: hypothetical protein [Caudoviricetes sp.]